MTYARLASITAWLLVAICVLGCIAGLLLELELGLGPVGDFWTVESYQQLFVIHGVPMIYGVIRPGLLAPVLLAHAARENAERNIGSWIASLGVAASLMAVGLALVGSIGLIEDQRLGHAMVRWMNRSAAIGDAGIGLGVLVGLFGRERAPNDAAMRLLSAALLVMGLLDLIIDEPNMAVLRGCTTLGLALVIVVAADARRYTRALWSAVALTAATILDVVGHAWFGGSVFGDPDLSWSLFVLLGMLIGMTVLLGSEDDGPARPVLRASGLVLVMLILARLYLDSLSVDVHIADSYLALADVHLRALFVLALGGSLMLRRAFADRYERCSAAWVRATPWMIAGGLLTFAGGLGLLGWLGMPRRYYAYLPELSAAHQVTAVAAIVLCAALIGEALLWIRGRPRPAPG